MTKHTLAMIASIAGTLTIGRIFPTAAEGFFFPVYVGAFFVASLLMIISAINDLGDRIVNAKYEASRKALEDIIAENTASKNMAISEGKLP